MAETHLPPLGIFDSGLGGLTVLGEILRLSPAERLIYIGDTANVPYGPRSIVEVQQFSVEIARFLVEERGCRAVVIACNTATSAAAEAVRAAVPVPVIAMEPGVKPAVAATRSGIIGVLATVGTLTGNRFATLVEQYAKNVRVLTQPCPGWVEAVESGDFDSDTTRTLVRQYVEPLIAQGADTLSLGCTHYPLLRPLIADIAGANVTILDTGEAVARRVLSVAPALTPQPPLPILGEGEKMPEWQDASEQHISALVPPFSQNWERGLGGEGGRNAQNLPDPGPRTPLHYPPTTDHRSPTTTTGNPTPHIELLSTGDIHRFGSVAYAILDRCGFANVGTHIGHLTWNNGELYDDATN